MSHFRLIASDLPVAPLLVELDGRPDLWNTRAERRAGMSPHREASDIWVRYMDPAKLAGHDFNAPHESIWYPVARVLPSIYEIIFQVRKNLGDSLDLGGVLITRIGPGCQVYPHDDRGTWHSEWYNEKVWVVLRGNDRCINRVEDESMVWEPGSAWQHDNLISHAVENSGETERLCLILCFRRIG